MVKSDLASLVVDFGTKKSNPRGSYKVTKITPHHMAAVMAADDCARSHLYSDRQASANYYIGKDGTICAGVSEDRRAWTSYSRENDFQAITIEVSDITGGPSWLIGDAAYKALVKLCADICRRYDIIPHYTGAKGGSITTHNMFQNTLCPGPDLENRIKSGQFEKDILAAMGEAPEPAPTPEPSGVLYRVQTGAFKNEANAQRQAAQIAAAGFDTYIVKVGELLKVQTGAFRVKENAEKLRQQLAAKEFDSFITTEAGIPYKPGTGKKDPEEIALEVKAGKWGNDPERSERLRVAGYDPKVVQMYVNALYKK